MIELAHVRNMLVRKKFGQEEIQMLSAVRSALHDNKTPFAEIILNGIDNCLVDVSKNDFDTAKFEINLIHNFPILEKDINNWDERHFYTVEMLTYLENVEDVSRIKKIILLVSKLQDSDNV